MWIGVRQRFQQFHNDLLITVDQTEDGITKQLGIRSKLEQSYYEAPLTPPHGFMVGSWGKGTQIRPPRDLDLFYVLPNDVFTRVNSRTGNKQSGLLQEIKLILQEKYTQSELRGDGQVVLVSFNTIDVEVVPVFSISNDQFLMPDSNNGGRWKIVDPLSQINFVNATDRMFSGNLRMLARMIKLWKGENKISIKSFIIELLVAHFLHQYENASRDFYWYDWMVRDFFIYLSKHVGGTITLPGTSDVIHLGNDWHEKLQNSIQTAHVACSFEYDDCPTLAGQEWQKIFGYRIPMVVT